MVATIKIEEQLEIPLGVQSLADFREWAASDDFPQRGRIDFLSGSIEVEMSPEDLFCHGTLKTELIMVLGRRAKQLGIGHLFTDSTRVSCPGGDLSVEPDIVFLSHEALSDGRVRLVPKSGGEPGRFVELEGPPDMIVEIVSDASAKKDTERLPKAYARAGVREFWLADARGRELFFRIHRLAADGYQPAEIDEDGYQHSAVFNVRFRLDGQRNPQGQWAFDLREATA